MHPPDASHDIRELAQLQALFDAPRDVSVAKEIDHVDANYAPWIAASPFCVLATAGPGGLFRAAIRPGSSTCSTRRRCCCRTGGATTGSTACATWSPTLEWRFCSSFRGSAETLRVNGRARINADPRVLSHFTVNGKAPKLMLVVSVEAVYFQCSRALLRSELWNAASRIEPGSLPRPGKILADITGGRVGGDSYDRELPDRVKATLY